MYLFSNYFNKTALIVLRLPVVFTISSFEIHQVNCRDFVANDEWPPARLTSFHWIVVFWDNAGVLSLAVIEIKNSGRVLSCNVV